MLQFFGILSGIFAVSSFIPYIKDILRLKTKPQRTTFLIWSILALIALFSQFAKGATYSLLLPGSETLLIIAVFLLSIKYGVGGFHKRDYITLTFVFLGLLAWYITREAAIALYLVILIDLAGTWLTVHKAYLNPESETIISWVLSSISGVFAALAVGQFNFILLAYPIYIFLANASVVTTIHLGNKSVKKEHKKF